MLGVLLSPSFGTLPTMLCLVLRESLEAIGHQLQHIQHHLGQVLVFNCRLQLCLPPALFLAVHTALIKALIGAFRILRCYLQLLLQPGRLISRFWLLVARGLRIAPRLLLLAQRLRPAIRRTLRARGASGLFTGVTLPMRHLKVVTVRSL